VGQFSQALKILAIIGVFVAKSYLGRRSVALDLSTLCPQKGAEALTVVVLDRSDPLDTAQKESLKNYILKLKKDLALHEEIAIYSVGNTDIELRKPVIDVCNPGTGVDASPLNANPALIHKRWEEEFSSKIDRALDQMLEPAPTPWSPIMETIQSVAISAFGREQGHIPKRLVFVSDMVQNTKEFSQYSNTEPFAKFRTTAYFSKIACRLEDVDVTVLYLRRDNARRVQGKDHVVFWQDYFAAMNGRLKSVVRLEG
jgi:hypothetical protein